MAIIRRRSATGVIQRLFVGANVQADSILRLEARATTRGDVFSQSENIATLSMDRVFALEAQTSFVADLFPLLEILRVNLADSFGQAEASGSAAVQADSFARLENRTILTRDIGPPVEARLSVIGDAYFPLESLFTLLQTDIFARLEYQRLTASDLNIRLEGVGLTALSSDTFVRIENLTSAIRDASGELETITRTATDIFAPLEASASAGTHTTSGDVLAVIEFLQQARRTAAARLEATATPQLRASVPLEALAASRISSDTTVQLETIASLLVRATAQTETLLRTTQLTEFAIEVLLTARADGTLPLSVLGQVIVRIDEPINLETVARFSADTTPIQFEHTAVVVSPSVPRQLENLQAVLKRIRSPLEALRIVAADFGTGIEQLAISVVSAGAIANLEISSTQVTFPDVLLAVIEFGGGMGSSDAPLILENTAIVAWPLDPDVPIPIDGPYLVLDRTHTNLSASRVRLITKPFTAPGVQSLPFDPMPALTMDTFGFDFTGDVAAATIMTTEWTATFDPTGSGAVDDVPQARVIAAWAPPTIWITSPLDNVPRSFNGAFTVAAIGAMPLSAVGGVYTLITRVTLSDTRILTASSQVTCVAPPGQTVQ